MPSPVNETPEVAIPVVRTPVGPNIYAVGASRANHPTTHDFIVRVSLHIGIRNAIVDYERNLRAGIERNMIGLASVLFLLFEGIILSVDDNPSLPFSCFASLLSAGGITILTWSSYDNTLPYSLESLAQRIEMKLKYVDDTRAVSNLFLESQLGLGGKHLRDLFFSSDLI